MICKDFLKGKSRKVAPQGEFQKFPKGEPPHSVHHGPAAQVMAPLVDLHGRASRRDHLESGKGIVDTLQFPRPVGKFMDFIKADHPAAMTFKLLGNGIQGSILYENMVRLDIEDEVIVRVTSSLLQQILDHGRCLAHPPLPENNGQPALKFRFFKKISQIVAVMDPQQVAAQSNNIFHGYPLRLGFRSIFCTIKHGMQSYHKNFFLGSYP